MRKSLAIAAVVGVTAVTGTAVAATRTVKIGDNYFIKSGGGTVTVTKNTTVKWVNRGRSAHNVSVRKGPVKFRSSVIRAGRSYSRKMTRAGTYTIICTFHTGQRMTLKVK